MSRRRKKAGPRELAPAKPGPLHTSVTEDRSSPAGSLVVAEPPPIPGPDWPDPPTGDPAAAWLSWRTAAAFLDVRKTAFFDLARRADFPRPRYWSGAQRWRRSELDAWAAAQAKPATH